MVIHFGMADPRERPSVHGLMVAGVAAVVATGLLLVNFLDHPFEPHVGGIQPTAMSQTLTMVQTIEPGLPAVEPARAATLNGGQRTSDDWVHASKCSSDSMT